jgi:Flp pilus assembly protein TadB
VATGHPLAGLTVGALFPFAKRHVALLSRQKSRRALEDSALAFFHGLQGLLRAGFSLPSALFRLSETLDTPFSSRLRTALAGFDRGSSLAGCLDRFQDRARLTQAGVCLDLLVRAHDRGLALGPFLDRVLPWLEEEARERDRVRSVRSAAFAQAGLASLLPWMVAFYAVGSPLGWNGATRGLAFLGLALQLVGFRVVARVARFE